MARGRFISLEGGEGSGKSTQARRLAEALERAGRAVVVTREPGGTPRAEQIRAVLFDRELAPASPMTEALLFNAARRDHLDGLIRPALAEGKWIVCDRFMDSTRAYQGAAGGVAPEDIATLERLCLAGLVPDVTLILDLDPGVGLARARARQLGAAPDDRGHDPFEGRDLAFHRRLRAAYLEIAAAEPQRCVVIDAGDAEENVHAAILAALAARLGVEVS
jgi:dTMP kinase